MNIEIGFEETSNLQIVDVRTKAEYDQGHIKGAINVPIFTEDERAEIGTAYKQESQAIAKRLGVKYVSKKLPAIYEQLEEYLEKGPLVFQCARGGMRSKSIAYLLKTLGHDVYVLKGGFKAYRQFTLEKSLELSKEKTFVMIHGNTGVGKTKLLSELSERGYDCLDLEGLANHMGSILGGVGKNYTPTQLQFELDIFHLLYDAKFDYIFLESEDRRVGKMHVPQKLYDEFVSDKHILIKAEDAFRVKNILEDYTGTDNFKSEILKALYWIKENRKQHPADEWIELVEADHYAEAAKRIMLEYYDPLYSKSEKRYTFDDVIKIPSIIEGVDGILTCVKTYDL